MLGTKGEADRRRARRRDGVKVGRSKSTTPLKVQESNRCRDPLADGFNYQFDVRGPLIEMHLDKLDHYRGFVDEYEGPPQE